MQSGNIRNAKAAGGLLLEGQIRPLVVVLLGKLRVGYLLQGG
jgi:hypothetical protein